MNMYNRTYPYLYRYGGKAIRKFEFKKNASFSKESVIFNEKRIYLQLEKRYRIYVLSDLITELKNSI